MIRGFQEQQTELDVQGFDPQVVNRESRAPAQPLHVCLCRDKLIGVGGAERVIIEQAQAFVDEGYRCSIVVFQIDERARGKLPEGVSLTVLGEKNLDDLLFLPKLFKLAAAVRRIQPNCVIAHQSLADYLRLALLGTNIPYLLLKYTSVFYQAYDKTKYSALYRDVFEEVLTSLSCYEQEIPRSLNGGIKSKLVSEYYALRDWFGTRGAEKVFTLGSRSRWELEKLYKIKPVEWTPGAAQATSQDELDPIVIETLREKYGLRPGQAMVLSVNRLEYRKRVHLVVGAMRRLLDMGVDAKLIVVGIGEEQTALENQVVELQIEDSVAFAGLVDEKILAQLYHTADVVGCMIWGSWALAVVEPLFYNTKVVISNEVSDLLQGVPNVFRASPDPVAVADALGQALSTAKADSARVVIENVDWKYQNNKLLDYIRTTQVDCKGSTSVSGDYLKKDVTNRE